MKLKMICIVLLFSIVGYAQEKENVLEQLQKVGKCLRATSKSCGS